MLDLFGPTLTLYCSPSELTLTQRRRFGRNHAAPIVRSLTGRTDSFDELLQQLKSALTESAGNGEVIDVVVADAFCRLFVTKPPSNVSRRADLDAAVALRFQNLYGESATDWLLRADWQVDAPFITAAIPQALYGGLCDIARAFKLRIVHLAPACITAWNRWRRAVIVGDWFGEVSNTQLTLIAFDGARIQHVDQQPLDNVATAAPDWLTGFVQREALQLNLSMPSRILCGGHVPSAWLEAGAERLSCHLLSAKNRSALARNNTVAVSGAIG